MPPKKHYHPNSNRQSNKPYQTNKNNQNNRTNQCKISNKQKDLSSAKLPKFITFGDQNSLPRSTLIKPWPYCKTYVVDFYPRVQASVTFIDSTDDEQLNKHLHIHQQDIIFIDLDWTPSNPLSVFEICTKKGALIIRNSKKSDILINFLKSNSIFTKGSEKVKKLMTYIDTNDANQFIDIDEKYIIPKRYPRGFDYLLRTFLGEPKFNFRPKNIRHSNWLKKIFLA